MYSNENLYAFPALPIKVTSTFNSHLDVSPRNGDFKSTVSYLLSEYLDIIKRQQQNREIKNLDSKSTSTPSSSPPYKLLLSEAFSPDTASFNGDNDSASNPTQKGPHQQLLLARTQETKPVIPKVPSKDGGAILSKGSAFHHEEGGILNSNHIPCDFASKERGCLLGERCPYCHLCGPVESSLWKKMLKKQKKGTLRRL